MRKTAGEWLLFCSLSLFCVLCAANILFAILGLYGSLELGTRDGFNNSGVILLCSLFGSLLVGEIAALSLKPEGILESTWPNVLIVGIRSLWLGLALLLLYGLFWEGGLAKFYWAYLSVAVILIAVNLPLWFLHAALCASNFRQDMWNVYKKLKTTSKK